MEKMLNPWFVIITAGGREPHALSEIEELGINAYLPQIKQTKRIGRTGRRETTYSAMFPSYLFAKVPDGRWGDVRALKSVFGFISTKGKPKAISEIDISNIRRAESVGEFDGDDAPARLSAGDLIEIVSGPMEGITASFVAMSGDRAKVDFNMMGARSVTVKISDIKAGEQG